MRRHAAIAARSPKPTYRSLETFAVDEVLCEDADVALYRARTPAGRRVLLRARKSEHPSPSEYDALRREVAAAREVGPDAAVEPEAIETLEGRPVLVLRDDGGTPLSRLLDGPMPLDRFLRFGLAIARAVATIHGRQMVHGHLTPAEILVLPDERVEIAGLGEASGDRLGVLRPLGPSGWPYLSPEQTGRVGLPIDQRTDLYSLGVILYRMLTGELPYRADDLLAWIHAHTAAVPPSPDAVVPGVPASVAAIVMRLLAKVPEDRYQSAAGLVHDLERGARALASTGHVPRFAPGEKDAPTQLRTTTRIHGRSDELAQLERALASVERGARGRVVLLEGPAGAGKSAVLDAFLRTLVRAPGGSGTARCDALARAAPYGPIVAAVDAAVVRALESSGEAPDALTARLAEALGVNAPLLPVLLPSLAGARGASALAPPPAMPESERRFVGALDRLLSTVARAGAPLVLALEDLHWADRATCRVLEHWLGDGCPPHVLVAGTIRDLEPTPAARAITSAARRAAERGSPILELPLEPLSEDVVARWIADLLRSTPEAVARLSAILHQRSGGNPLYVSRLLARLSREGHVRYSPDARAWRFDLDAIRAVPYADDVAVLIASSIADLEPDTREALRLFASHGASATLETLAIVLGGTPREALDRLDPAFEARLIARIGGEVRFLHDRIRQVAYELAPERERPATHLHIARALLARIPPDERAGRAFEIVPHLDRAASLFADDEAMQTLSAEVHLEAGRAAQRAGHFEAAVPVLRAGLATIGSIGWQKCPELAVGVGLALARSLFVAGELEEAARLCGEILGHGPGRRDAAIAHGLRAEIAVIRGAFDAAVNDCLEGLRAFGVDLARHPTDAAVEDAHRDVLARIADRRILDLAELPAMQDEDARAVCDLLSSLYAPAVYTDWNLAWIALSVAVSRSIEHGNASSSAVAYAGLGVLVADRYRDYRRAFELGECGHRIACRPENVAHRARAGFAFVALLSYLRLPIQRCIELLRAELETATAIGDPTFACYLAKHVVRFRLFAGDPLEDVADEAARAFALADRAGFEIARDQIASQEKLIARLRGDAAGDESATDEPGPEPTRAAEPDDALDDGLGRSHVALARFHHYFHELERAFLERDVDRAVSAAEHSGPLRGAAHGFLEGPEERFYAALALAQQAPCPEGDGHLAKIREHHEALHALCESNEASFGPRETLLAAEIARLEGDPLGAERAYEQAIRGARRSGLTQVEAIASELAARFHRRRALHTPADAYLREARDAYAFWGAHAKVRALLRESPQLSEHPEPLRAADAIDPHGIAEAAQAISSTLVLPRLHTRLLEVATELAGARRASLVRVAGGEMVVAGTYGAGAEHGGAEGSLTSEHAPITLLRAAIRTKRPIAIADAAQPHRFSSDPYFVRRPTRSVLCLPIVRESTVAALLYLENDLVPGAFSARRLVVLDLLASQAAIALENARLFTALARENSERRRAEAGLAESRAKLQAIIDNTPATVFVKDLAGRYVLVNRRWTALYALGDDEAIGRTDRQLFPREIADRMEEHDRRVLDQNRALEEDEIVQAQDGEHVYMTVRFPLRDGTGRPYATAGIAADVTTRKHAEEELRRLLSLTEAAFESTADAILVVDREGTIVRANRRFVELWGVPEEILESRDDDLAIQAVLDQLESPDAFLERVRALYAEPDAVSHDTIVLRDGRVLERDSLPQRLGDEIVGRVWSFRDVTWRVRAERQREQHLEEERRARAEAERAVRVRDEFLSIASHELRTPLTSLLLAVQSLREHAAEAQDPRTARVISVADRQVHRLTSLVGLLLDVSRIRGGRLELGRSDVDLASIVRDVAGLLADQAARAGCTLRAHADQPVRGQWDGLRLEQVVTNLLTNAIKFGKGAPIDVRVESADGGGARLVVADHGIGMEPEVAAHIFEPFQRGVSSRHYGGLGLGLYITRSIVQAHGGTIEVASEVGRGSTFTVTLPPATPERASPSPGEGTST